MVYLYTYHNKPPFIVDIKKETGLNFDLAKRLTHLSKRYRFMSVFIPRKRLDHMIENNQLDGVVMGANPLWFGDPNERKFLWMPPYYSDRDDFISLKSSPFEYTGKESLKGKVVAAVAGYYYVGINEAVEEGSLLRIDTVGEREVLQLIEKKRADMGLVSSSVFKYLKRHHNITDIYHLSTHPHDTFNRRPFTSVKYPEVRDEMTKLMEQIKSDGSWKMMLLKYQ